MCEIANGECTVIETVGDLVIEDVAAQILCSEVDAQLLGVHVPDAQASPARCRERGIRIRRCDTAFRPARRSMHDRGVGVTGRTRLAQLAEGTDAIPVTPVAWLRGCTCGERERKQGLK